MEVLKRALIFITNIVFPPCCLICSKHTQKYICNECKKWLYERAIYKIEKIENSKYYFEKHLYIFSYKDEIRNLILNYKFKDKSYLYKAFSEIITNNKKIYRLLEKYDIIIPVPIHKKRKKLRGYDQSELIAIDLAKKIINLKLENKILQKTKNTLPQSNLNKKQREQNVKEVYKITKKEKITNKKIILLDDIYTTGNTANECSKILKQNGAKEVIVLTLAKD